MPFMTELGTSVRKPRGWITPVATELKESTQAQIQYTSVKEEKTLLVKANLLFIMVSVISKMTVPSLVCQSI